MNPVYVVTDTAANFIAANPILFATQEAIESDTGRRKIGDGKTSWTSLGYAVPNIGSSPVATVGVNEYSNGKDVTAVLTLTNFIVGALAGAGASLGIGNIVYAFPAGQHIELAYALSGLTLTCPGTGVATKTGLGSVIASGAISVLSGTATFQDRLAGVTITTDPSAPVAASALAAPTAGVLTGIGLNVAASVKNVFLNAAGAWNANNTGNLLANGVIVLKWTRMQ